MFKKIILCVLILASISFNGLFAANLFSIEENINTYLKTGENLSQVQSSVKKLNDSDKFQVKKSIEKRVDPIIPFLVSFLIFSPLSIGDFIQGNPNATTHLVWGILSIVPGSILLFIPPIVASILAWIRPFEYSKQAKEKLDSIFALDDRYINNKENYFIALNSSENQTQVDFFVVNF